MGLPVPICRRDERLVDGCIHVLGVTASTGGAVTLLVLGASSLSRTGHISLAVYAAGLIAVFCFSAAYHLVSWRGAKEVLRRFDQAAIYFKIAATYTPFALIKLGGFSSFGLLAIVWGIAAFGMANKLVFPQRLIGTGYALYLVQGWSGLVVFNPLASALSNSVLLLLTVGGVLYTIGVVFFLWRDLRFHLAIWHSFVLAGSMCCYIAVSSTVGAL